MWSCFNTGMCRSSPKSLHVILTSRPSQSSCLVSMQTLQFVKFPSFPSPSSYELVNLGWTQIIILCKLVKSGFNTLPSSFDRLIDAKIPDGAILPCEASKGENLKVGCKGDQKRQFDFIRTVFMTFAPIFFSVHNNCCKIEITSCAFF